MADDSALTAEGWSSPTKILCAKNGPMCDCGSFTYRARRLEPGRGANAERMLYAFRCEGCGHTRALDAADPGAVVDLSGNVPQVAHQDSLF